AVDPGPEDAVVQPRLPVLARRIQLAVLLDAVPAVVPQRRLELQVVAVLAAHVGVVAVEADLGRVRGGPAEEPAGRPPGGAVDFAPPPARLAVGAGEARQLAAVGAVPPARVELQVIAEVHLLRLLAEPLAETVVEVRPGVGAGRDRHLQALALAAEGRGPLDGGVVGRRFLAAPAPPPLGVLEVAGQYDVGPALEPGLSRGPVACRGRGALRRLRQAAAHQGGAQPQPDRRQGRRPGPTRLPLHGG